MRFEDLTIEDQKLVNTDFGDFDKEASEKLAEANEVYSYGQEQAHIIADQMDEAMAKFASDDEDEDDEDDEELDEESEKKAAELGSFIERGMFDELTKLGSERYNDPMHYYYPYMEEKVAQIGAEEKLAGWQEEVGKKLTSAGKYVKDKASKGWKATKDYHSGAMKDLSDARTGLPKMKKVPNPNKRGRPKTKNMETKLTAGERIKSGLTGTAKFIPHGLALGGAGYGGKKLYDRNS